MGMAIEFRWMELKEPDGYYVRIGNRPFVLQTRDEERGTPWTDVPLQFLLEARMRALPASDPVRSLS